LRTSIAKADGTITERYEYDAYGKPYILDADYTVDGSSDIANPYLFTGRQLDTLDSGGFLIQYSRARYYDYETGRWYQRDPLGYVDGMGLYEYVRSMSHMAVDPFGLESEPTVWRQQEYQVLVDEYVAFWLEWLGAMQYDPDTGRCPLQDGCEDRIKCVVRAISWVESFHGTGEGQFPERDPMQAGNPDDDAHLSIMGIQFENGPKREGDRPGVMACPGKLDPV
jgi:RHS repeat-associated protein